MDEKKALIFINRIVKECNPHKFSQSAASETSKMRALLMLDELYEILNAQGADRQVLSLVEICRDEFADVLVEYQSGTLTADKIYKARENARIRREVEARSRANYGRC